MFITPKCSGPFIHYALLAGSAGSRDSASVRIALQISSLLMYAFGEFVSVGAAIVVVSYCCHVTYILSRSNFNIVAFFVVVS
jgi:hypothetical protein